MIKQLSVLALSLGCSVFTAPGDFPHAVASFQCGPADGAATGITLASQPIPPAGPTPFPYVAIMIEQPCRRSQVTRSSWAAAARQAPRTPRAPIRTSPRRWAE